MEEALHIIPRKEINYTELCDFTAPMKQPRQMWVNHSCESFKNGNISTIIQSTTKQCTYFMRYPVYFYYMMYMLYGKQTGMEDLSTTQSLIITSITSFYRASNLTRPPLERRKTLGHLRSINPNMINHYASQSQTCQLLKILKNIFFQTKKMWKVVQLISGWTDIQNPYRLSRGRIYVYVCVCVWSSWHRILMISRNLPGGR